MPCCFFINVDRLGKWNNEQVQLIAIILVGVVAVDLGDTFHLEAGFLQLSFASLVVSIKSRPFRITFNDFTAPSPP